MRGKKAKALRRMVKIKGQHPLDAEYRAETHTNGTKTIILGACGKDSYRHLKKLYANVPINIKSIPRSVGILTND
jgi:hypothetical protein